MTRGHLVATICLGLFLAHPALAGVDCGPNKLGAVLNDGCDMERRQYCRLLTLPNPPGWSERGPPLIAKALAEHDACVARKTPSDGNSQSKDNVRR